MQEQNHTPSHIRSFFESPLIRTVISKILIVIVGVIIVACIFLVGETVGYHKVETSYRFGENYNRIFEGQQGMHNIFLMPIDNMFSGTHGAFGKIVKITLPQVVIVGQDGLEKIIVLNDDSIIKEFRGDVSSSSLSVGDTITVLGSPDDTGQITAKLIRVVPSTATSTNIK